MYECIMKISALLAYVYAFLKESFEYVNKILSSNMARINHNHTQKIYIKNLTHDVCVFGIFLVEKFFFFQAERCVWQIS